MDYENQNPEFLNPDNDVTPESISEEPMKAEDPAEDTIPNEESAAAFTPFEELVFHTEESAEEMPEENGEDPILSYEEPIPQPQVAPAKKSSLRVVSLILAFAVGAAAMSVVSFLALPKLVEREVSRLGGHSYYQTAPNPSMSSEQAGAPNQDGKKLLSVVEISRKVGPAVVGINTTVQRQTIFGTSALASGSGSGIILSSDGYIVTNNHVIEGANAITVSLSDGEEYQAVLIGADARTDLAVVKIEGDSFPAATLGNSSQLQVGELAIAIGNPLGNELAGSVTGGYISALNRSITVDDQEFNLIQTDAAINPGNSGGALVNNYGEVIGINSVKMAASGVEGIGFAIPIDEAKPIIDDLIANGYVKGRPVIGIAGINVTEQDSKYYDIPVGIYVKETTLYSAAERAGIKTGDVIVEINGVKVKTVDELNQEKEKHKAGDTVTLTIIRGNDTLQIPLVLQEDKPQLPQE